LRNVVEISQLKMVELLCNFIKFTKESKTYLWPELKEKIDM